MNPARLSTFYALCVSSAAEFLSLIAIYNRYDAESIRKAAANLRRSGKTKIVILRLDKENVEAND